MLFKCSWFLLSFRTFPTSNVQYFSKLPSLFKLLYPLSFTSPFICLSLLPRTRNGIYPMTAFGLPCPQQPQQETVKSPIVVPLVKSPTPEPAELETRRVCTTHNIVSHKKKTEAYCGHFTSNHPDYISFFSGSVTESVYLLRKVSTIAKTIHIWISLFLWQVIHMQCNVEAVEEGAKYHVSLLQYFWFNKLMFN